VTAVRAGGGGSGTTVGAMATHATAAVSEELAGRLAKVLTAFHSDGAIPAAFGILTPEGVLSMKMKLFALAMVVGLGTVGVLSALPAGQPAPKADAKAKAAKPDEPPKEDFGRLPQDKRPKLVEIVDGGAGQYNVPLWLDGGKRLVLIQQYGAGETKVTTVKKVAGIELVRGFDTTRFLGTTANGSRWVGFETKGSGINSYSRLVTWDFADPLKPYAKRLGAVDFDRAADGEPERITPDGKTAFTLKGRVVEEGDRINPDSRPTKIEYVFRALDAATGEPVRTVAKVGEEEELLAHEFSPAADRLYLVTNTDAAPLLRCIDTATGKVVWAYKFPGAPAPRNSWHHKPIVFTADGLTLAVANRVWVDAPPPARIPGRGPPGFPGGRPRQTTAGTVLVLDALTGKERITPAGQGTGMNGLYALSPDGRLLAGWVATLRYPAETNGRESFKLVVWDLKTGKILKSWEHPANQRPFVTFAPNRPLMVLGQPSQDGKTSGTLGFWDLSGLLK